MVNNENLIPKTETISYYDVDADQNLTVEQWQQKQTKDTVTDSGETEIVNKSGSNFISEKEGYGPCYVCYEDEITAEFRMACPAEDCSNRSVSYWSHNKDSCRGSRMLITNKGMLSCGYCSLKLSIANWNFSCSQHYGDYRSMSQDSWELAMGYTLLAKNKSNNATKQLNVYVTNHPEKFGFEK